jgi:hypothetical protein
MPAKPTGSACFDKGKWRAKVTIASKRPSFALPTCSTKEEADERAHALNDIAMRLRAPSLDRYAPGACDDAAKAPIGSSNAFRKSRPAPGHVTGSEWRQSRRSQCGLMV